MKRPFKTGGFFAKADGAPSWRDRLAKLRGAGKPKPKPTAKLEIDDANGETLIFPEIGDVSEIAEGVAVTATDGEHIFVADAITYTVTVAGGLITAVVETPVEDAPPADAMSAETAEFVEAVAFELETNEAFRTTAQASIDALTTGLATANATIATLKATMSHKAPKEGEGDDDKPKSFKVAGKTIDLTKINLK